MACGAIVPRWLKEMFIPGPQLTDDDIVVFVVGPSGSGKSTFVTAVTQACDLVEAGRIRQAQTNRVQVIRCQLTAKARETLAAGERRNIVFVDTPSFHNEDRASRKAENKMTIWLEKSRPKSTLVGTIYLHTVEDDPDAYEEYFIQKQLNTFSRTFPRNFVRQAFPARLHCIFSYIDEISQEKVETHRVKFRGQIERLKPTMIQGQLLTWNTSIHPELFVKGGTDVAWNAIKALFAPVGPH